MTSLIPFEEPPDLDHNYLTTCQETREGLEKDRRGNKNTEDSYNQHSTAFDITVNQHSTDQRGDKIEEESRLHECCRCKKSSDENGTNNMLLSKVFTGDFSKKRYEDENGIYSTVLKQPSLEPGQRKSKIRKKPSACPCRLCDSNNNEDDACYTPYHNVSKISDNISERNVQIDNIQAYFETKLYQMKKQTCSTVKDSQHHLYKNPISTINVQNDTKKDTKKSNK